MNRILRIILILVALFFGSFAQSLAQTGAAKHVLIVFEGADIPSNYGKGDAKELGVLLGHFSVTYRLEAAQSYKTGDMNGFDRIFYIGYSKHYEPPDRFLKDLYATQTMVIWMNTGFERYCDRFDVAGKYGFRFAGFDTVSNYSVVNAGGRMYTKGEPNLNIIEIKDRSKVKVIATAYSPSRKAEQEYVVQSGNFLYIADSPFSSANETDRYIYFADYLHDILGQNHEESHRALIRIEDVDLFEDPARLREIADVFYAKKVPFLVGVIPFYVDPQAGTRLSLSDKPEFVDAIRYMVSRGATIVMHGATHQYQGVTAVDFEFWDGSMNRPIRNDSKEYVEKKLRIGLEEFWKNNIYPTVWETPHYTATQLDYDVFSEFFSTAMEQRMVLDDPDYSQYYPYIIERDPHGQRIIPETLGYIPMNDTAGAEEASLQALVRGARAQLGVRDGFASAFIHPVIDVKYMEEYVDSVQEMGYTFMDVRDEPATVRLKDRVIVTGSEGYEIALEDQYLREVWLKGGDVDHEVISDSRMNGVVKRTVDVPAGQVYLAEPSEYHQEKPSFFESLLGNVKSTWENFTRADEHFNEIKVGVKWDPAAKTGALNDQSSFASTFRSLNIPVDTLDDDTLESLSAYNLLVVPYNTVEKLSNSDYDKIVEFVQAGGNVITDAKNEVARELGMKFAGSSLRIERLRDQLYPEDPLWLREPEIMTRYETERGDEVFCSDDRTEAPVAIGRQLGKGKFIYLGLRFDPVSTGGYSRFPYLMEYVQRYFKLRPVFKRENLEVYFDPGFRRNVSVEDVVKHWVDDGVRRIHVNGWQLFPQHTYDYARLIKLCHANGILVYVWLEPPMISLKFWTEHPEWREVNYKGEQIPAAWRSVVALTNPACLAAAKDVYRDLLNTFDWDGVNLAELYFESGGGPNDPQNLNPMHPSAREEFRKKNGFDPVSLMDTGSVYYWKKNPSAWKRYEEYRVETIARLHDEFLTLIDQVKTGKPYLDVVVTVLDNLGTPELRANLGVDVRHIIPLARKHAFRLQIEDPQSRWSDDPRRYEQIAKEYAAIVPDSLPVMVDLNILQFRPEDKPSRFPTMIQTGIESYQLIRSAALGADRFGIYSESSVRTQDLRMFGFAASARASIDQTADGRGWEIDTPFPLTAELPASIPALNLSNGQSIYSSEGKFYLPPGQYTALVVPPGATPFSRMPVGGKLFSITGTLEDVSASSRSITFKYKSGTRCFASFNHPPYNIIVDGQDVNAEAMEGHKRFSVMLPPGEHTVIAVLETSVSYGVDITSFWSSWLIVIFGVFAGAALITFYLIVRISRPAASRI